MEMRVVLATLFARATLRLPDPPARVTLRGFFFAPRGGTKVIVEERRAG
jgi:cytochrome P450